MDPEDKNMLIGAGTCAGVKLGVEGVWAATSPPPNTFPYINWGTGPGDPLYLIPPLDAMLATLGTPALLLALSRLKRHDPKLHAYAKGAALYGIPEFLGIIAQRAAWFAHAKGVFAPPGQAPFTTDMAFPTTNVIHQGPYGLGESARLPWQRDMRW